MSKVLQVTPSHLLCTPQFPALPARKSSSNPDPTPDPDCLSWWQNRNATAFAVTLEKVVDIDDKERLITHANCKFSQHFGREGQAGHKRAKLKLVKVFTAPFRTDKYAQHDKGEHSKRWKDYKESENKAQFFQVTKHTHIAVALARTGKCTVY